MRVAVIGGRLQGLEAVYLAGKAGWETVLVDKFESVPARNLCDHFFLLHAADRNALSRALKGVDLVIPALENSAVLAALVEIAADLRLPLAFDQEVYQITVSKERSDRLFAEMNIPAPRPWPDCSFPIIAKPAGASGSEGVALLHDEKELQYFQVGLGKAFKDWVYQEYLEGPSYSLEVIGCSGSYLPLQVTALQMDESYDCKRVLAPSDLSFEQEEEFAGLALRIARAIKLEGIMDVEVILHDGMLKVLEIDARLPSQTPTAVYHSTGINMLELIESVFVNGTLDTALKPTVKQAVIFEHVAVEEGKIALCGEHIVASAGPLKLCEDIFGANEALTNYEPGRESWMATLIITGDTIEAARQNRSVVIERIRAASG